MPPRTSHSHHAPSTHIPARVACPPSSTPSCRRCRRLSYTWGRLDSEMATYIGDMIRTTLLDARADRHATTVAPKGR